MEFRRVIFRSRRAAEEDRLGERPVQRHLEAVDGTGAHQTKAPPPNEKKDRKKLDAAKAIDRPKTIWISLRKPPLVSPNASANPVMMIMMTATKIGRAHV